MRVATVSDHSGNRLRSLLVHHCGGAWDVSLLLRPRPLGLAIHLPERNVWFLACARDDVHERATVPHRLALAWIRDELWSMCVLRIANHFPMEHWALPTRDTLALPTHRALIAVLLPVAISCVGHRAGMVPTIAQ